MSTLIIGIITALLLPLLKQFFINYKKKQIDKDLERKKEEVNEIMQDFNKQYSDFKHRLDEYRSKSKLQGGTEPSRGVQQSSGEEQGSDTKAGKSNTDSGKKD
jgi:hypothetical protein